MLRIVKILDKCIFICKFASEITNNSTNNLKFLSYEDKNNHGIDCRYNY